MSNTPNKFVLMQLKKLPEPYRNLAIRNHLHQRSKIDPDRIADTIYQAVDYAFTWIDAPEPKDFWYSIHVQLVEHDDDITKVKWPELND